MRKLSVFYEHILQACEQSGKTIPEVLAFCREQGISAVEVNYSLFASERGHCPDAFRCGAGDQLYA